MLNEEIKSSQNFGDHPKEKKEDFDLSINPLRIRKLKPGELIVYTEDDEADLNDESYDEVQIIKGDLNNKIVEAGLLIFYCWGQELEDGIKYYIEENDLVDIHFTFENWMDYQNYIMNGDFDIAFNNFEIGEKKGIVYFYPHGFLKMAFISNDAPIELVNELIKAEEGEELYNAKVIEDIFNGGKIIAKNSYAKLLAIIMDGGLDPDQIASMKDRDLWEIVIHPFLDTIGIKNLGEKIIKYTLQVNMIDDKSISFSDNDKDYEFTLSRTEREQICPRLDDYLKKLTTKLNSVNPDELNDTWLKVKNELNR